MQNLVIPNIRIRLIGIFPQTRNYDYVIFGIFKVAEKCIVNAKKNFIQNFVNPEIFRYLQSYPL